MSAPQHRGAPRPGAQRQFEYSGRTAQGSACNGRVLAWDRERALQSLREDGITVLELAEDGRPAVITGDARLRIPGEVLAMQYRQMHALICAAIPIDVSMRLLSEQDGPPGQRRMYAGIAAAIQTGATLSSAMSLYPNVFGPPHVAMVAAGEQAGIMSGVIDTLASLTEQAAGLQRRVRTVLAYPALVVVAMLATVAGIFNLVLPQLVALVANLKVELPLPTRLLLAAAAVLRHPLCIALLVGLLLALPWTVRQLLRNVAARQLLDTHSLRAVVVGDVTRKVAVARALMLLSALARAGLHLPHACRLTGAACGNRVIGGAFESVAHDIGQGRSIADAMRARRDVFPSALVAYVESGELSGQVPAMRVRAADVLSLDATFALEALPSLLEPLIVAVLGVMIAVLMLAVFLPIYGALRTL